MGARTEDVWESFYLAAAMTAAVVVHGPSRFTSGDHAGYKNRASPSNPATRKRIIQMVADIYTEGRRCFVVLRQHPFKDSKGLHTANRIQRWFTRRRDVDPVDWPPNSPDMNPFQNLWAAVKRILRSNWAEQPPVRTPEELWDRVLDAWEKMAKNLDLFHNFVDSMPRRMRADVDAGGLWTRY
ncbi:hypothetical protein ANN_09888 [Periplaneta americana]|uniref:Tc1-like transposase DDE domain-containing protein n=1 Tax=Periplaneta americana TaxID=6978 RepID=A0ABQ8TMJ0_PERAM|nr:hypothetical protein ANN_09888 [Periplaneta americana]